MSVREALYQRPDVPDEDVDDSVALAARLQAEQTPADRGGAADIAAVAAELDIEPQYVERALQQWQTQQEADTLGQAAGTTALPAT